MTHFQDLVTNATLGTLAVCVFVFVFFTFFLLRILLLLCFFFFLLFYCITHCSCPHCFVKCLINTFFFCSRCYCCCCCPCGANKNVMLNIIGEITSKWRVNSLKMNEAQYRYYCWTLHSFASRSSLRPTQKYINCTVWFAISFYSPQFYIFDILQYAWTWTLDRKQRQRHSHTQVNV